MYIKVNVTMSVQISFLAFSFNRFLVSAYFKYYGEILYEIKGKQI